MKIGTKIILGFVFVSILLGVVGYLGIYANKVVVDSFETSEEHFGAIIEASNEVSSFAKRAEGHAMLYLTLNNGSDKTKFSQRIDSLREQISIIDTNVTDPQAKKIATSMSIKTDELQSIGESLFTSHDNELNSTGKFGFENHETSIRRLDDVAAEVRRDGLALTKLEIELQQAMNNDAKTNADLIQKIILLIGLIAVTGSLLIGYFISRNITNILLIMEDAAIRIGAEDINSKINVTSKDELGDLAKAFNMMTDELQSSNVERMNIEQKYPLQIKW